MDPRRHAPATARNRWPILAVLRRVLPPRGLVLEVASGTGEHAAFFAAALTGLVWQPTDPDADARASVAAWCAGLANVRPPLALDAAEADWPVARADAVVSINMVHIARWAACEGLVRGAARVLLPCGPLVLYGPFMVDGAHTGPGNVAFDAELRARDPAWGLREVAEVARVAAAAGLDLVELIGMPADNRTLVFRRR